MRQVSWNSMSLSELRALKSITTYTAANTYVRIEILSTDKNTHLHIFIDADFCKLDTISR